MKDKDSYTPKEVAEYLETIAKFAVARSRFYHSGGTGEATTNAEILLGEIKKYKEIPENIRSEIKLDMGKLEAQCREYYDKE